MVGEPEAEILRDRVAIPDQNAFVTLWVSVMLLEAARIKNGPLPTDEQISMALEAINSYHDNNSPAGDSTMVFWPQSYNSSVKQWYCYPPNLEWIGNDVQAMLSFLHEALDDLHLEKIWEKMFEGEEEFV